MAGKGDYVNTLSIPSVDPGGYPSHEMSSLNGLSETVGCWAGFSIRVISL